MTTAVWILDFCVVRDRSDCCSHMSRTWKHRFASCFFRSDQLTCNIIVYVNVWKFSREKKGFEIAKVDSRCFCWFPAAMLVPIRRGTNIASHTKLSNFPWYIFSNNSIMRYRTAPWLSPVVYVSLFYNLSISWPGCTLYKICRTQAWSYLKKLER